MKRTYRFVEPLGTVVCDFDGRPTEIPVVAGILKHPTVEELRVLLTDPIVVRRYVREAIRKAPWSALRWFPRWLLLSCLEDAPVSPHRRAALRLLLEA